LVARAWWKGITPCHQPLATNHRPRFLIEADWMHGPSRQAGKPLGFIRVLQARDAGTGSPVSPKGPRRLWSGTTICYCDFARGRRPPKQGTVSLVLAPELPGRTRVRGQPGEPEPTRTAGPALDVVWIAAGLRSRSQIQENAQ
jgi:hypothetical protein